MDFRNPKNSKGQVERLARLYYRKLHSVVGASLGLEDIEQEFWLVWHAVCQRFDPSRGFDFEAFLGVSIRNRAIALHRHHRNRKALSAESVNRQVGDNQSELIDLIEDDTAESVEKQIALNQQRANIMGRIDPKLRRLVELLEDTPKEIEQEVEALQAKAAHAASLGLSMRSPKGVTISMLSGLMGINRCARYDMIDKIQEIIENE